MTADNELNHNPIENDDDSTSSNQSTDSCEEYISFQSIRDPSTQLEEAVSFCWPGIFESESSTESTVESGEYCGIDGTDGTDGTATKEIQGENQNNKQLRTITLSTLLEEDDLAPLFDGSRWAGTRLWGAAVRAIQYISDHEEFMPGSNGRDVTLLELGCGLGVPGMIYHMLGGSVVLTDQAEILSQLEKNVLINFPDTAIPTIPTIPTISTSSNSGIESISKTSNNKQHDKHVKHDQHDKHDNSKSISSPTIQAMPLSWSKHDILHLLDQLHLSTQGFDIVLNCDCVYEPLYGKSWELLVETINELLRVNRRCKVITSVERRHGDGIDDFLREMEGMEWVGGVEKVFVDERRRIEIYVTSGKLS